MGLVGWSVAMAADLKSPPLPDLSALPKGLKFKIPKGKENDPEIRREIGELIEDFDRNPLFRYFPHAKQAAFHAARRKIKVFNGGNRSGKSTAGVCDDLIQCVDREALPEHLAAFKIWEPPFYCRIVTPDFGVPFESVMETLKLWCPEYQLKEGSWEAAYSEKKHKLEFANGSFIEFMTLEQDVKRFGGPARHRVHFDEEPAGPKGQEIREECAMRLADFNGDELFTFSPVSGYSWTFDELLDAAGPEVRSGIYLDDEMVLVVADIDDNRHVDKEGKKRALAKIRETMLAARKEGKYTHAQGLVYPMFDVDLHVVDEDDIPREHVKGLIQYDGIDPGQVMTAILFAGYDKDDCLLIYDELPLSGTSAIPENAAPRINAKREEWGIPIEPDYRLIDPSSRSRNLATGERIDMAWARAGIRVLPAKNDLEMGVLEVARRMAHSDAEDRPAPQILISSRCERLLKEIARYRQKPKEDGSFGVVKENDHFCDVMRYIAAAKPLPPPERKRRQRRPKRRYVPGTAPPYEPPPRKKIGAMGRFS